MIERNWVCIYRMLERDEVFIAIYRMLDRDKVLIYKKNLILVDVTM